MPVIFFTVTNDLSYDQRMIRICTSLQEAGNQVTLVGRKRRGSIPLSEQPYTQERLYCLFEKGKLFYAEYNIRLFLFLLFKKMDCICAIDLDTIIPCYYISKLKNIKRVLDSHEYFSQQKEIITRPRVYKAWHWIERRYLPKFPNGYTVSQSIAAAFKRLYQLNHEVVRNVPLADKTLSSILAKKERYILYQGAVNEARGLEYLIPAMKHIDVPLHIYGDGNFMEQTKALIAANNLADKVLIKGTLLPGALAAVTRDASIGVNLVEHNGLNQYYSLANKFFDFIQQGIPQVTMNFPEYSRINAEYHVALLIDDLQIASIVNSINALLSDEKLYLELKQHCMNARKVLNWQNEEKKLLDFYKHLLG